MYRVNDVLMMHDVDPILLSVYLYIQIGRIYKDGGIVILFAGENDSILVALGLPSPFFLSLPDWIILL